MSLEVFVRASGSAMGLARDAFGFNAGAGTGLTSTPGSSARLAAAVSGSGQAASAAEGESAVIGAQGSALSAQNLAAHVHLDSTLAAAGAGRSQMDSVIAAALADINSLAAATTTPAGQLGLVQALVGHLGSTSQILTNGQADSSTRAASATQLAAGYNALGNGSVGGLTGGLVQTSPAAYTGTMSPMGSMSPLSSMSSMQTMSMLEAAQMAASQAAMSGTQAASTQQAASNGQTAAPASATQTIPPNVQNVLGRAKGYIGTPYSYGGGTPSGPTVGSGTHTRGFDCSSFVQMAYWPYVHLPRTAHEQMSVGTVVSRSDIKPGDLIFSEFGEGSLSSSQAGHVQMAVGYGANSQVISAAHTGTTIGIGPMESGTVVIKRLLQ